MRTGRLPVWAGRAAAIAALVGVVTGVITWFALPLLVNWMPAAGPARPPAQGPATLPAVVGAPSLWTPAGDRAPIGSASVLYTSDAWFSEGDLTAGLVGSGDDVYRVYPTGGEAAGMGEVLSPDGTRVAGSLGILDLATGVQPEYPPVWAERWAVPQAWSPDGTTVAFLAEGDGPADTRASLFTPATGEIRELARLGGFEPLPGWAMAFSPDGSRVVIHTGAASVRVITLADGTGTDVPIPDGARPAGKGAWSRDGANLLVVSADQARWTVTEIAVDGGTPTGRSWSRDGVFALRVLGWWPSGDPVAAEYTAEPGTPPMPFDPDEAEQARLIDLGTGRVLLIGAGMPLTGGDVESFDVADRVLAAGAVRPGDPPFLTMGMALFVPLAVIGVSIAALLSLALWWAIARVRAVAFGESH